MKVGVFLDDYVPQDGGAFTFQGEVLESLAKLAGQSRHQFVVISAHPRQVGQQVAGSSLEVLRYRAPGIAQKALAFLARNWPNFRSAIRWRSNLERQAREAGLEFIWFLSPRTKEVDTPFMAIVYDLQHRLQPWFPEVSRWGQWDTRERGLARFLGRASAVISGTQAGKDEILRFYRIPEERIYVLPHPTPTFALDAKGKGSRDLLERFNLHEGYLLYPAQFWPHKNHYTLLLALQQLRREHDLEVLLVLVGSDFGNQPYIEEQVAELGLGGQVRILGFVNQAELVALYQNALALTYLTFFGPENLPPLEAMALGCPVIASAVSGAQEQLGDAAILVNPTEPQEIASAIRRLLGDARLRQRLIKRGLKRAAKWTMDDFVRAAFGILDDFEPIRRVWKD